MKALNYLIVLPALLVLFAGCDLKPARHYLREAEKLSAQGKYRESNLLLDKAIAKDGQNIAAYIHRGANKSELKDHRGAIADFQKVLALDTSNMMALFNSGNSYKQLGDYKTAIKYYSRALGDYSDVTGETASVRIKMAGEFDIEGSQVYFERGDAHYRLGHFRQAYIDMHAALERNYRVADCYLYIGYIFLESGQTASACKNFQQSRHFGGQEAAEALQEYCK
ncbi:tetratricopeptide repeat protein [Chitinophaga sp. GCM10012297]|uniref:Tetratricopeptide repeat protein n=1 Tax=Chitinophaga chungangae TaxID=2821488 RepID=A0ABS3YHT3_9BACT|nr:tetratricopeptide repeat protein [Chitinophaga chungangae]MBO9154259.1 tetratricopeptide repeat protein [Chitinophaga chungangae]